MGYHKLFICLVTVTTIASFINYRYIRLPKTIFLTFSSAILSLCIILISLIAPVEIKGVYRLLSGIDFRSTILDVMLGYLLFASTLRVNSMHIKKELSSVIYLSSFGVVLSAAATGGLLWLVSYHFNMALSWIDCLIFGALISPIDAIAVVSIFKASPMLPQKIEARIIGESLFNDAVSVMLLIGLTEAFYFVSDYNIFRFTASLVQEFCGAILCGLLAGWFTSKLLQQIDDNELTILITISLTSLSYMAAQQLGASPIITMVIIGLYVGWQNENKSFSATTSTALNNFWELVDDILNAFMFVLIGLEMLTIPFTKTIVAMGLISVAIVFASRYFSIYLANLILFKLFIARVQSPYSLKECFIMSWGGLRGGISLALAWSVVRLSPNLLPITYIVVVASILIQGITLKSLIERLLK